MSLQINSNFQGSGLPNIYDAYYSYAGGSASVSNDVRGTIGSNWGDDITFSLGFYTELFRLASFSGGSGYDRVSIVGNGAADLADVTGVEAFDLLGVGHTTMPDSVFAGIAPSASDLSLREISVTMSMGSSKGFPVLDASAVAAGHNINLKLSYPMNVTLGAGDDVISGSDIFNYRRIHGGLGVDTLYHTEVTDSYYGYFGTPQQSSNVDGVGIYRFSDSSGEHYSFSDDNFAGITGNVIIASLGAMGGTLSGSTLSASNALWLYGSAAQDALSGGAADDMFGFSAATLGSSDAVAGGAGHDQLLLLAGVGAFAIGGVSGVEYYQLSGAGSVALTDANFASVTGALGVRLLAGGTVDASAVMAGHALMVIGGGTGDHLIGCAGDDIFSLLGGPSGGTTVVGGGGNDLVLFPSGASGGLAGLSGVEFYDLSQGTANSVTIADTNVAGLAAFGMQAGNGGDRFDLAGLTDFGVMHYLFFTH